MNIWEQTLARIETKVNRHSFYTWFKPTTCILDGGDHLTIRVPNGLFRDWLLKHYGGIMADALAEIGRPGHVALVRHRRAVLALSRIRFRATSGDRAV